MMKRLICTLAALAMLIWTCPTARAELIGELRRDQDRVINFDNATVEEVLEKFLQRRIVIAPEINQQPFLPRIVPGSVLLITLS